MPQPTVVQSSGTKTRILRYIVTVAIFGILGLGWLMDKGCDRKDGSSNSSPVKPASFTLKQLAIASQTLFGHWVEEDVLVDDQEDWTGTTAVVSKCDGKLVLISNSHCLGLAQLANADSSKGDAPEVKDYQLMVHFANGQKRAVLRMAETTRRLDLALLEVDAGDLREGIDYTVLAAGHESYSVGDDVVAVGSPFGVNLQGTHTFGKISAIRPYAGEQMIQHNANINPGNSGGPLFLKTKSDLYVWIGVNTLSGGNGLGFSIVAPEALTFRSDYEWCNADKQGAAQIIRKFYNQPNTTVVP